ncbi:MAG: hypothetical protein E4G97_06365 [Deltaproteobacteria bacterium]|nr:MAG: hypothetical protein E4G97_06365 [Deltaproteobacteria bacterium]
MSNIITGAIAAAMAVVFFMYYAIRLYYAIGFKKSLPVFLIVLGTLACLLYDFVTSFMENNTPPGK